MPLLQAQTDRKCMPLHVVCQRRGGAEAAGGKVVGAGGAVAVGQDFTSCPASCCHPCHYYRYCCNSAEESN